MKQSQEVQEVNVFGRKIEVHMSIIGPGAPCLLVFGPATIFAKKGVLPHGLYKKFNIYFADVFLPGSQDIDYKGLKFEDFVNAVDDIRGQLKIKEIYLFAHSALGVVALEATRKFHKNIKKTILVCASTKWGKNRIQHLAEYFESNAGVTRKSLSFNDKKLLKKIKHPSFSDVHSARRTEFLREPVKYDLKKLLFEGIRHDPPLVKRYFELINGTRTGHPYKLNLETVSKRELSLLKQKLFLCLGLYDYSAPLVFQPLIGKGQRIPYHIFMKSGHYPMFEQGKRFSEVLEQYCFPSKLQVEGGGSVQHEKIEVSTLPQSESSSVPFVGL